MISSIWRNWIRQRLSRRSAPIHRTILRLNSLEARVNPATIYAVGSVPGTPALVTVFDANTNQQKFTVSPFGGFTGGVNVALGDVNADGTPDIIAGAGAGGGPIVSVYDGVSGALLKSFMAGDESSRAGVSVAAGDFDQDGTSDILVGAIRNGQPLVQVMRFSDNSVLHGFAPFVGASSVSVAAGDVNGDGVPDVIAGSGAGIASNVIAYNGQNDAVIRAFNPFESTFIGGVTVAAGDMNADGKVDIIVSARTQGGPRVSVYSGLNGVVTLNFFAYSSDLRDGAFATAFDANADGNLDVVTTNGPNNLADPKAFSHSTLAQINVSLPPGLPASTSYDTAVPTATVTTTASNPTGANPIPFTATFSEAVNGLVASGITVTNGSVSAITRVNAKTYTISVIPTTTGDVSVAVAANGAFDSAGNRNTASAAVSVTFDGSAPTVTINPATTSNPTPVLSGTVSEATSTVQVEIDGQTFAASVVGTTWTATVPTALADGTYTATATATDTLGNSSQASATVVIDSTAPTPTITSSSSDPTSTSPIPFRIAFDEDVTGFDQSDITLLNGSIASFTSVDGKTYDVTVTPGGNALVSISVAAGVATDAAGNPNNASNLFTITFDTGAINVTANSLTTNNSTPTLTGTVDDSTATVTVTVDGQVITAMVSGNNWSADVPVALLDGTYDIQVDAEDTLGNTGTFTLAGGLVIDTVGPTPTVDSAATDPVVAGPILFTVTFDEAVTGFDETDLTILNGTVALFTALDAQSYEVSVTPTGAGLVTVSVDAGVATDAVGNPNVASNAFSITFNPGTVTLTADSLTTNNSTPTLTGTVSDSTATVTVTVDGQVIPAMVSGNNWSADVPVALLDGTYDIQVDAEDTLGNTGTFTLTGGLVIDTVGPTPTVDSAATDPVVAGPILFTVTFDEAVTGFDETDLTILNGTVALFTALDAQSYEVSVTPTGAGLVTVSVDAGVATDAAGNPNVASNAFSITFNPGTVTLTADSLTTNNSTPTLTGTVDDSTATVTVTVDGQVIPAMVSGNNWSADVPVALLDGTYDIQVDAEDTLGNSGTFTLTGGLVIDTVGPTPTLTSAVTDPTNEPTISFSVDFGEVVTGFVVGGIAVTNGDASTIQGSGSTYTFDVVPSGEGTVTVTVAASAATDTAGNVSEVSNTITFVFDSAAPVVGIDSLTTNNTTPALTGTVDDSTATVTVTVDGQTITAVVTGNTWSADVPVALSDGTYDISATATDAAGNIGTATLTGGLIVDTAAPVVNSITANPSSGTFVENDAIDITVTFSEPVILAGGSLFLTLDTGVTIALTQGADPAVFTVTYTVGAGESSSDLDSTALALDLGATLVDTAGNAADLTIPPAATLATNADIVIDPGA